MMAAQHVAPYRKSGKNDANDAEAICEAMTRPGMRFVTPKSNELLGLQAILRVRSRLVQNRTSLGNQVRGFLSDNGIVSKKGHASLRKLLPSQFEENSELTVAMKQIMRNLYEELVELDDKIKKLDEEVSRISKTDETCKRISQIEGIGPQTAVALRASVSDFRNFKTAKHFAAYLGLTPRQNSSGGKTKLGGITKQGDVTIRTLLIHGARSVLTHSIRMNKSDRRSLWVKKKHQEKGYAKAAVALANKNARIVWALMSKQEDYRAAS
jgi:transposase